MTSHTKEWKASQLAELKKLIAKYHVIAIADIRMFPAALFQQIRKKLHGKAVVRVSKTRIIKKAFDEAGEKKALSEHANANCAVIFTTMNPFELFSFLKRNKGKVAATPGAVAGEDIMVPAGDTGLPPGPALSDLKAAGLKVAVQGATIAVMQDKIVTRAGEEVSEPVANTLAKLNILPFKVGLKLVAAIDGSQIFKSDVLDVDPERVFSEFADAHKKALNLAVNAEIANAYVIELLISKSFANARAVALGANLFTSATAPQLIAKASAQASSIKALVKDEKKEGT